MKYKTKVMAGFTREYNINVVESISGLCTYDLQLYMFPGHTTFAWYM